MKIAFLDLDGTLLDSSQRHVILLRKSFEQFNIECGELDDYLLFKSEGNSTKRYLVEVKKIDDRIASEMSSWWVEHIEDEIYLKSDHWYSDSLQFVQYIKELGYFVCILTARKNKTYVKKMIHNSKIKKYVDFIEVVSPVNATEEKEKFMGKFILEEGLIIGDTEVEYKTAQKLGIDYYILNRGFRSKTYWDNRNVFSSRSLDEIKEMLQ